MSDQNHLMIYMRQARRLLSAALDCCPLDDKDTRADIYAALSDLDAADGHAVVAAEKASLRSRQV